MTCIMTKVTWLDEPEEHDYPAAASYLALIADADLAGHLVDGLRDRRNAAFFKAKDILRAAGLALLPPENPHVASDLRKIHEHKALSPILLVRGDVRLGVVLQIADGYHRVCASYHTDENTDIPCRITQLAR